MKDEYICQQVLTSKATATDVLTGTVRSSFHKTRRMDRYRMGKAKAW